MGKEQEMTREEALQILDTIPTISEQVDALEMAIQALSQEPCSNCCNGNQIEKAKLCQKSYLAGMEHKQAEANNALNMCDDAISREAVKKWICKTCPDDAECQRDCDVIKGIDALPSVTQKAGKWIEHPEIETSTPEYLMFYECSECGDKQCFCKSDIHKKRFCNNCGAKMVESQESEDKE